MESDPKSQRTLKTTETSIDVLELMQAEDGIRLTEIAEELDILPSTAHAHLATLENRGFVVKEDGRYHVGLELFRVGEQVRNRKEQFQLARPKVERLSEETQLRSHFIVEEHGMGFYLYTSSGEYAVTTFAADGKKIPLHAAAAGKSILANYSRERVESIIKQHGLECMTPQTITDADQLFEELETVRERGIAYNDEESVEGIRAIGVPVTDHKQRVVGALSVAGPVHRLKGDIYKQQLPDTLLGLANEFELELTYAG